MSKEITDKIVNIQTGEELDLAKVEGLQDNKMLKVNPHLFEEWDFEENNKLGLNIYNLTYGSGKKAWWIGKECGHEWDTVIFLRSKGKWCPYCNGSRLLVGFNDMWTTNPKLANLLADKEDGYRYMQSSDEKVDWKCPNCNSLLKNKRIADINKNRLYCQRCNKGKSVPEMFVYHTLLGLKNDFEVEKTFDWSEGKRYDFYLPNHNTIIEVHGEQHYSEKFNMAHKTSLEQQITNDNFKKDIAINNGIERYIVIEARKSQKDYLINNTINNLRPFLNTVDSLNFDDIYQKSLGSRYKEVCDLWNDGLSRDEISSKMKLPKDVITRYLRRSKKDNITSYIVNEDLGYKKSVVQLDTSYSPINTYASLTEASIFNNVSISHISYACKSKKESESGYFWMYEEDYNKNKDNLASYGFLMHGRTKRITQLNLDGSFVAEWKSRIEASESIEMCSASSISSVLSGKTQTAAGFRWLYKDDYDKNKDDLSLIIDFSSMTNVNPVVQLSLNGEFIKLWDSVRQASDYMMHKSTTSISNACRGVSKSSGGYRWVYEKNYDKLKDEMLPSKVKPKKRAIVQLTKDGILIKEWNSATDASIYLGAKDSTAISRTLRGKSMSSNGFKWMYKDNYEESLKVNNI